MPHLARDRTARLTGTLLLAVSLGIASAQTSPPPFSSTTTLVVVPALVRSPDGALLYNLAASDFRLLDNGVPQQLHLETTGRQPIAIVALLQIGASAPRHFADYAGLPTMLAALVTNLPHQVAVVTFDSAPEEQWDFTTNVPSLADAFLHPTPGDNGAAVLDAVAHAITLLKQQPPSTRRIILLISQNKDQGSTAKTVNLLRDLGENNIAVESLSFSPEKTWLHDQFTEPRHENKPYQFSPVVPPLLHTFDLGTPLGMAISALRTKTTPELAILSGGESLPFSDHHSLDQQLNTLINHLSNRYLLTFQPSSHEPGLHTLQLTLPAIPDAAIAARTSYWSESPAT